LLILDANPLYAAPSELGFAAALKKVRLGVHAGLHLDETGSACAWHVPVEHDLETWSDARAVDGTASLIQPLVRPVYAVRSRQAVLETVQGRLNADPRELVAATWRQAWGEGFDARWSDSLRKGLVDGSAAAEVAAAPVAEAPAAPAAPTDALELVFRPDPCLWDGRFANNPWLQELPKPLNTVTWDNVLAIGPALAREMGLANGDLVKAISGGRSIEAPVWITPGQARRTATAFLGYGRRLAGQVGDGHGYDAFALRTAAAPAVAPVTLARTGRKLTLAAAQLNQGLQGYDFVREVTLEQARGPKPAAAARPSLYPDKVYDSPSWGMSVDTDLCIGCNACVTACDAENNIAMVGKDQVAQGRVMHWLRIDHYFEGDPETPTDIFQPVPCMHCEQAPCEAGCPVNATVHSPDGLNVQVYNRCIGTRTCSSYCPYKVRHFNWFDLTSNDPPERQAQRNPNVTVRGRGVRETCSYCIQRITDARIQAEIEHRPIRDGEVKTACQQTCPTDAIVFGDVTDPKSMVSRRKAGARDYTLLEEANTRPRTTYLARIAPAGRGGDEETG
jgi:molybdopterin-containing oxidoreductase family iron-sulfur binding subunit